MTKCNNADSLVGKYVISPLDGKRYCRKNGQFKRHIQQHGYSSYQQLYDALFPSLIAYCSCGATCSFDEHHMVYLSHCGNRKCAGKVISKTKKTFPAEKWEKQREKFRQTMAQKPKEEKNRIIQQRQNTYYQRHGVHHRLQQGISPESLNKLSNKEWMFDQHISQQKTAVKIAEDLQVGITTATNWLHRHDIPIQIYRSSQVERDIVNFISTLVPSSSIHTNDRKSIQPLELDIYLPNFNLAFEINGVFWHGEGKGKGSKYHINKTNICKHQGIRLVHVLDSEWLQKRHIIESRIANMIGKSQKIHARSCKVVQLSPQEANTFMDEHHLQGKSISSIRCGLVHKEKLVACMTFSKSRFNNNYQYELVRFANMCGQTVVGGAGRLFSHFVKGYKPKSIISYSDKRWNIGNLYKQLGFSLTHVSPPGYKYFATNSPLKLYSRQRFQKHKLCNELSLYDPNLSEWENMQNNGFDRIWDCGTDVYGWKSK